MEDKAENIGRALAELTLTEVYESIINNPEDDIKVIRHEKEQLALE